MNIYLEVYGCTANKSDASLIKGVLKEYKHNITNSIDDADVLVLLTCTVIDTTEQRMISRLKQFKKTGKKIIVAGCMASAQSDTVKKVVADVQVLPPQYTHQIIDLINNEKVVFKNENKTSFPKCFDDIVAPISISEGCMFSCSYCITSVARGKLKSFPVDEIKKDVKNAIQNGCKEIQLTAQDTASYGMDCNSNLGVLLKNISQINGDYRIRVGMMNPYTALKNLDSIIEGFNDYKIYKFIHLPVQSGDNQILKKMNRKYSVDDFLNVVKQFRKQLPDITLSTDIIVGFPTETDTQFQNTVDLIKNVKPDIVNITRYSARPFTRSKTMNGRIKTEVVKNRSRVLTQICSNLHKEINHKHIGKKYKILVTEIGKNQTIVGRSENYKPVVLKENIQIGEYVSVEITDAESTYLIGKLI